MRASTTKYAVNFVSQFELILTPNITLYLVERNVQLDEYAASQDPQGVIQVRVQQLALCKLLVNVHRKSLFMLVTAYA